MRLVLLAFLAALNLTAAVAARAEDALPVVAVGPRRTTSIVSSPASSPHSAAAARARP